MTVFEISHFGFCNRQAFLPSVGRECLAPLAILGHALTLWRPHSLSHVSLDGLHWTGASIISSTPLVSKINDDNFPEKGG